MLPEVESSSRRSGVSSPLARACCRMAAAGRSLTEPPGLNHSAFANTRTARGLRCDVTRLRRRRGVLPISASRPSGWTVNGAGSGRTAAPAGSCNSKCMVVSTQQAGGRPVSASAARATQEGRGGGGQVRRRRPVCSFPGPGPDERMGPPGPHAAPIPGLDFSHFSSIYYPIQAGFVNGGSARASAERRTGVRRSGTKIA